MLDKARRPAAGPPSAEPGSTASGSGPGFLRRSRSRTSRRGATPAEQGPEPASSTSIGTLPDESETALDTPLPDNPEDDGPPAPEPRTLLRRAVVTGGGRLIAPDWRERATQERETHPTPRQRLAAAHRWTRRQLTALRDRIPTRAELTELLDRRPSAQDIAESARRHRFLLGGLGLTLLLAAGDAGAGLLVTEQPPAPGIAHRVAVAHPLKLSTPVPSVRRYLDAIANGERLREQAVVAAAARATLERAKAEAAAAAAGQDQPWINSAPAPEGALPPGAIPPGPGGFVLPAPGTFTSGFGSRWGTYHRGIDVAGPIGTPIYAVADGTVIDAGPAQGFGLWVRIRHNDGTISVYGHMYDFFVSVGERVPAGMQIARMGNRGDSTGPHLHFEIIMDGQHVDPQRWLALHGLSYG
ncbi:peptidoglycan DD-metalloendopeptidase family protein [Nocardia sp. NPDC058499]|uniref:M23 family metallopeptidase n=1 Tax=Nocardia sp. NPDC058499 TaxID=3346530 RepID=UPI0036692CEA